MPAKVYAAPPASSGPAPTPALSLATAGPTSISGPSIPTVGKTSTYDVSYSLSNSGGADALNAALTIPVSATYVSASASSGTLSGTSTVSWSASGPLAAGAKVTVTVRVSVRPVSADTGTQITLTNSASASAVDSGGKKSYTASAAAVKTATVSDNALPVCMLSAITTNEDTATTAALGCTDADGDPISYNLSQLPTKGVATVSSSGSVSFTPSADLNGVDMLTVELSDGIGTTTKTITINITPVNDAPRCAPATISTSEDVVGTVPLPCVDPEGVTLSWAFSRPSKGSGGVSGPSLTYTPDANVSGSDSYTATASDGSLTASASITVTIAAVNDLPTCSAAQITATEDNKGSVTLRCADVEGSSLSYAVSGTPANGGATVSNRAVVEFTPAADFNGNTTVYIAVSDGTDTAIIPVDVVITPVNDAPRCSSASIGTSEDNAADLALPCADPEGTPMTWSFSTPSKGSVAIVGGKIQYTPRADLNGSDSFTATVSDGMRPAVRAVTR
jgi:VCBS repeat-containing protein